MSVLSCLIREEAHPLSTGVSSRVLYGRRWEGLVSEKEAFLPRSALSGTLPP